MRYWRQEGGLALRTAVVLALLAAPVGLIWAALAPRLLVATADHSGLVDILVPESEALIGADGYFLFLTAAVGLGCGFAAYALARRSGRLGPGIPVGLAGGGVAAGYAAAGVGRLVYYSAFRSAARTDPVGTHLRAFVEVHAQPVLLAWAVLAVAAYGLAVMLFETPA